jgi:hypothetical protein
VLQLQWVERLAGTVPPRVLEAHAAGDQDCHRRLVLADGQEVVPAPLDGQAAPQRVQPNFALDVLAPQHAVGDHALPLLADQLAGAQGTGVEEMEHIFGQAGCKLGK